jgi:hypothetical protein
MTTEDAAVPESQETPLPGIVVERFWCGCEVWSVEGDPPSASVVAFCGRFHTDGAAA